MCDTVGGGALLRVLKPFQTNEVVLVRGHPLHPPHSALQFSRYSNPEQRRGEGGGSAPATFDGGHRQSQHVPLAPVFRYFLVPVFERGTTEGRRRRNPISRFRLRGKQH